MSRIVVWTIRAQADFNEILRYLAVETPDFAEKVSAKITEAANRLGAAQTGRPGRVRGYYEKSLPDIRYIVAYSFNRNDPNGPLNIVRIVHTSRAWLPGVWPK